MVVVGDLTQRAVARGTGPNLWYKGARQVNIEPLAAARMTDGGIWRDPNDMEQSWLSIDLTTNANGERTGAKVGGSVAHDDAGTPRVVYANDFPMPWGWRVSSYFLTKGIAAGIGIAAAMALLFGAGLESIWMRWAAPLVAGLFLLLTGVLLVWDLKRPDRFYYLLTKGNPRSWLVRGAWILGAYAAVLAAWFFAGVAGSEDVVRIAIWAAAVIALGVAGYTAFLFGQAEGRDLWQSPSLLWHMLAGAFLAGGSLSMIAALVSDVEAETTSTVILEAEGAILPGVEAFAWAMVAGAAVLGLVGLFELVSRHPTRNIAEAVHHMIRGAFAAEWWAGFVLAAAVPLGAAIVVLGGGAVAIGAGGGVAGLAGIWLMDDAFVRAGQSVPLS